MFRQTLRSVFRTRCAKPRCLDRHRIAGSLIAMGGPSFDRWTRRRASAINRRSFLGVSLTAGIGAALGRIVPAEAQFSGNSCSFDVTLVSSLNVGQTVSGTLKLDIGGDGAIDNGSLTLAGQAAAPV